MDAVAAKDGARADDACRFHVEQAAAVALNIMKRENTAASEAK